LVTLNKIYTRTGDKGTTALGNGDRVEKHDLRVTAYGTVDEANSTIGLARLHASGDMDDALEEIDAMNENLKPLKSFILPGGSPLAAHLHLCRTVSRRAERLASELAKDGDVNTAAVTYLNRLSDWFFVASRVANGNGADDVLWVPGQTR